MVSMSRVKPAKMLMVRSRLMTSEMITSEGDEEGVVLLLSVKGGMTMLGILSMGAWFGEGLSDREIRLMDWDTKSWERAVGAWMAMVSTSGRFADFIAWVAARGSCGSDGSDVFHLATGPPGRLPTPPLKYALANMLWGTDDCVSRLDALEPRYHGQWRRLRIAFISGHLSRSDAKGLRNRGSQ